MVSTVAMPQQFKKKLASRSLYNKISVAAIADMGLAELAGYVRVCGETSHLSRSAHSLFNPSTCGRPFVYGWWTGRAFRTFV